MSKTTGPVLAIGAISMVNTAIFTEQRFDWRIPVATGVAVGLFALAEKALPDMAGALAWVALATVVLTRVDPDVPSPAENALKWFDSINGKV